MSDTKTIIYPEGGNFGGNGMEGLLLGSAMNGGGFGGGNGMWNSPWWALIFLSAFRNGGFFGNEGNGNNCQLNAIQEQLQTIQGQNCLQAAIQGGTNEVRSLANTLNCDINAVQAAINAVQNAICGVGNQVGMSSQAIINAVNGGQRDIVNQLCTCCCDIRQDVTKMGYENQIANLTQTNVLQNAINSVGIGQERGFSAVAFASQDQTCQLKQNANDNTRAILAKLDAIEDSRKDREIATLTAQLATVNARAERQAELAPITQKLNDIICKQPNTVTLPYSCATAVPTTAVYGACGYGLGLNGFFNGGQVWS